MSSARYNLLNFSLIKRIVKGRLIIFILRFIFVLFFCFVIYAGLFGSIYRNIASAITGTVWLMLISLFVILFGKVWCTACPWNTIAEWVTRRKNGDPNANFSLQLTWPKGLSNFYLPIFLILAMVVIEYSVGISHNPRITAYVAIFILFLTIAGALLFKRKSFCRYGCPVGVISGLYALFAPVELRHKSDETCQSCKTKDCFRGNEKGTGCPVFEFPQVMPVNTHCILCTECLKTCPYDNIGLNIRPPAQDISYILKEESEAERSPDGRREGNNKDERFLIILLLLFTTFHAMYTSPLGASLNNILLKWTGLEQSWIAGLLVVSLFALALVIALFAIRYSLLTYAYAFIPVLIFIHLGLTIKQFSMNANSVLSALSDPFGWNWNLIGYRSLVPLKAETIWHLQIGLIVIGILFGLYFILFRNKHLVTKIVASIFLISLAAFNLWLARPV